MIDPELDQLSRALIAATDRLNSEDFRDRQSRYVRDELALRELAEGLEADEKAVEEAQAALQRHVLATSASDPLPSPVGFGEGELFELASGEVYEIRDGRWVPYVDATPFSPVSPASGPRPGTIAWYENIAASKLHGPTPEEEALFDVRALPEDDDTPEESTARSAGALS